jgi:hypothetical protein
VIADIARHRRDRKTRKPQEDTERHGYKEIANWVFGVNFVAIAALVHLVGVTSRSNARVPDKFGLI